MSNQNKQTQLLGGLLLATGVAIGAATTLLFKATRPMKASLVLLEAKKQLSEEGNIIGSWIDYDPIEYDLFEDAPLVYIGGITLEVAPGHNRHYQFAADIYTGDLIDVFQTNPR